MSESLFYKPETEEIKQKIKDRMMYFHSIGDMEGVQICMGMLQHSDQDKEELK